MVPGDHNQWRKDQKFSLVREKELKGEEEREPGGRILVLPGKSAALNSCKEGKTALESGHWRKKESQGINEGTNIRLGLDIVSHELLAHNMLVSVHVVEAERFLGEQGKGGRKEREANDEKIIPNVLRHSFFSRPEMELVPHEERIPEISRGQLHWIQRDREAF